MILLIDLIKQKNHQKSSITRLSNTNITNKKEKREAFLTRTIMRGTLNYGFDLIQEQNRTEHIYLQSKVNDFKSILVVLTLYIYIYTHVSLRIRQNAFLNQYYQYYSITQTKVSSRKKIVGLLKNKTRNIIMIKKSKKPKKNLKTFNLYEVKKKKKKTI